MTAYIVRRLLLMIPTILGISVVCFLLCQFVPGGPVEQVISHLRAASSAHGASQVRSRRRKLRISRLTSASTSPCMSAISSGWGELVHFDLGNSYVYHLPVWNVIVSKMPISLFFGLTSFILSYAISIPLGVWKAVSITASLMSSPAPLFLPDMSFLVMLLAFI